MFGILCKRLQILVVPSRCIAMPSLISHMGFPQIPLFVVNYLLSSLIDDKKPNPGLLLFFFLQPPIPKLTEPKLLASTVHRLPFHPFTEPRTQLKQIPSSCKPQNIKPIHHSRSSHSHHQHFNTTTNYTIKLRKN